MREQFELGYDIPRIVSTIRFETGQVVSENTTLIVLDEIQACPKALTSLKYFCENAPGYAVAAAGSLLRQYYYVGGMPEAVSAFLERGLLEDAREIQL